MKQKKTKRHQGFGSKSQWQSVRFAVERLNLSIHGRKLPELLNILVERYAIDVPTGLAKRDRLRFVAGWIGLNKAKTYPEGRVPSSVSDWSVGRIVRKREKTKPIKADDRRNIQQFYLSWQWKRLRYDVLKQRGRRCECCGATPDDAVRIVVDHIKPIRHFWHLRLDQQNLQVLCDDCNMGKGSRDESDWRRETVNPESKSEVLSP